MITKFLWYIDYCIRGFPTGAGIGLLLVFFLGTVLLLSFLGIKTGIKWSALLLLAEYLVLLLILTVLTREIQVERMFDFIPFWSYRAIREGDEVLLVQNIANVFAFIPIGLLLGCALGWLKWWKVLAVGGGFSLLIEMLQFVLKRGFAEFDDIFHNVLGCAIGFWVYLAATHVVKSVSR